jgi:glycerol uptake facilitator protein
MAFMNASEYPPDKGAPAYLAEFVGTAILVLAITGFVSQSSPVVSLLPLGLVHALALMLLVGAIGSISGCHVNPAVTLALLVIRKVSPRDAGAYLGAQVAGGVVGALLARAFFSTRGDLLNFGAATVNPRYLHGGSVWLALLAEAVGAFILMWAVMGTAVNPDAPKGVAPWAIGGALGLAVLIFGPATGGSFNPARWFGPALVSGTWSDGWLYIIGPVLGAGIAAFSYISIMEASNRIAGAPQAPEVGESAAVPPSGVAPQP